MSDELERRLRESLRAYADVVDAPDDDALPTRPSASRPAVRRWRGAILAAAAAAAVVSGSVWVVSDRDGGPSSSAAGNAVSAQDETRADASASDSGAAATAESGGLADSAPAEGFNLPASVAPGTYPVDLSTHCGVRGIDIGGVWFAADPPLVEEGGSPPPGWDNPRQRGTVTLLTHDQAVFRDDAGHEVRLRADESARPPLCE